VDGQLADCSVALGEQEPGSLSQAYGYRHIVDIRRAAVGDEIVELAHNEDDGNGPQLHLTFLSTGQAELILGNGIEGPQGQQCEVVILRKTGRNVDFVSVIDPAGEASARINVRGVENLPEGVLSVEISRPDGSNDILLSAERPVTFEYEGMQLTGQVILMRNETGKQWEILDAVE
jgi:hypothetical protein